MVDKLSTMIGNSKKRNQSKSIKSVKPLKGGKKFEVEFETPRGKTKTRSVFAQDSKTAIGHVKLEGNKFRMCRESGSKIKVSKKHQGKQSKKIDCGYPDDIGAFGMSYSDLPPDNRKTPYNLQYADF